MCKLGADIFEEINENTTRKMRDLKDRTEDTMEDINIGGLRM